MTLTQTVDIPPNRRITVPPEVPTGRVILTFTPETNEADCPICAKHRDPITGNPRYNAETLAAFEEGDAMLCGEKPVKWYSSLDDMVKDLEADDKVVFYRTGTHSDLF